MDMPLRPEPIPKDWWPDELILVAKKDGAELGVAFLASNKDHDFAPQNFDRTRKALFEAMWQHEELKRLGLIDSNGNLIEEAK